MTRQGDKLMKINRIGTRVLDATVIESVPVCTDTCTCSGQTERKPPALIVVCKNCLCYNGKWDILINREPLIL